MNRIGRVVEEYNRHASDVVPVTFLTVLMWSGSQTLINEALKNYAPNFPAYQLAMLELFIASFGLWFIVLRKKEKKEEWIGGVPDAPAV